MFIVAEIGVNWDGNFILVKEMMEKAKKIGCDAVKFQSFNEDQVKEHPEVVRLMKSSISNENIKKINEISKEVEVEWFCTPMYEDAVDLLEPYVSRFKIREKDGKDILKNNISKLIEKIFDTKKEIIVSSNSSPKNCQFFNNSKLKWLYCEPKYPCELSELNFKDIKNFNGFSNHTPNTIAPITAAVLGAEIIEVHITSNKNLNFFDNNVSFDYNELDSLVKQLRLIEKIKR